MTEKDLIAGVEKEIIEKFLEVIGEKYPLVDKANYFLERQVGVSGINIAIANQRDFLSHLCTVVTDENLDYQGRRDQLSAAEEHMRRAIIETYQKAVSRKLNKFEELFKKYKEKVYRYIESFPELSSAPNDQMVKAAIRKIEDLRIIGRKAKTQNTWNLKFNEGVEALITAFKEIIDIEAEIEKYLDKAERILAKKELQMANQQNEKNLKNVIGIKLN